MSEIVSLSEVNAVDQATTYDNPETTDYSEIIDLLDRELFPIVVQNAEAIVPCPWMDGAEVSLSVAMNNYPKLMVLEDPQVLISIVNQLLANQIIGREEPKEESEGEEGYPILLEAESTAVEENIASEIEQKIEPEKKENIQPENIEQGITTEADIGKPPEVLDMANDVNQPSKDVEKIRLPQNQSMGEVVNEPNTQDSPATPVVITPTIANNKTMQPAQETSSIEVAAGIPLDIPEKVAIAQSSTPPEAMATETHLSKNAVLDHPVVNEVGHELAAAQSAKESSDEVIGEPKAKEVKKQIETAEAVKTNIETDNTVETDLVVAEVQNDEEEVEVPVLSEIELVVNSEFETEHVRLEPLSYSEKVTASVYSAEPINEEAKVAEVQSGPTIIEHQVDVITTDSEEEVLAQQVDMSTEEGLATLVDIETNSPGRLESAATSIEQSAQPDLLGSGVGEVLTQLAEHITDSNPEEFEATNERLDIILQAPVAAEATDTIGFEAQEELEKLFTELLDEAGIEYTPEVLESLKQLTANRQLLKEIKNLKKEKEVDEVPDDTGTNESIIQMLIGRLSSLQKAIMHAGAIGRSALKLSFSLAIS